MNIEVLTPNNQKVNLCQKINPGDIIGVFHYPQTNYLNLRVEFKVQRSEARFLVEFHLHPDDKLHHGTVVFFNKQKLLIEIISITRLDEYAGRCEEQSNEIGLNPEYCICDIR